MWERRGALDQIFIKKVRFVMAMLPPGGGRNNLDPRFLSHCSTIIIPDPIEETQILIYFQMLKGRVEKYWPGNKKLEKMCKDLATSTIKTFDEIYKKLSRTPIKFHYIFNLRDINKVYEGVMLSTHDK